MPLAIRKTWVTSIGGVEMSTSGSNDSSFSKVASLRQSFRASSAAAGITAVLLFFLIGGSAGTSQALVVGLIFPAIGAAFTFWIMAHLRYTSLGRHLHFRSLKEGIRQVRTEAHAKSSSYIETDDEQHLLVRAAST
jgi:hypothetical protein